ncbi:LytTR family DNA-binding domain-containing protein [Cytophagales bacterium LB-30]|uniref:LytTR family DNA-binding domain-containing protein n=1 Tax=Shiella aurantiaca TaxID=3058365 RepID=A0ABT8F4Q5_9BACT|nr:LytTR family DNA-binding domain-containing protein [Shiella aurantiaca]MDN4165206.1 LytTR family DNA-binding domain-containing protein [Shiella aurantiaca]
MKIFIVEDDPKIRATVKSLVGLVVPEADIVGEAHSVAAALQGIPASQPDVLLLDVEIEGGTTFDVLAQLPKLHAQVIFITAHDTYAIQAIKCSALDYIVKPIDPDDLEQALVKAETALQENYAQLVEWQALKMNVHTAAHKPSKLVLKDNESIHLVDIKEIIRCESSSNYTTFYLLDGSSIMVSKTMKEYEGMLEGQGFFRVHQSHLINLHQFARLDKREGGIVIMKDGSQLPVAVRKKEDLLEALSQL